MHQLNMINGRKQDIIHKTKRSPSIASHIVSMTTVARPITLVVWG